MAEQNLEQPEPEYQAEQAVSGAVSSLLPLYFSAEEDRADNILSVCPNPSRVVEALQILIDVMFPGKMWPGGCTYNELGIFLMRRLSQAWGILRPEIDQALTFRWRGQGIIDLAGKGLAVEKIARVRDESNLIINKFYLQLSNIRKLLVEDTKSAYDGDPAALSFAEVQLAYPGLLAIASHRLAHELYKLEVPIIPRVMNEWTHGQTGIDIHPGAEIGHGFFIDHGTGVVIGETTKIGNRVKIYQGVTLGAKSVPRDKNGRVLNKSKRHPTVEDDVVIYANATILGGDTTIGSGSTIGGNVFLVESVPAKSFVSLKQTELSVRSGK